MFDCRCLRGPQYTADLFNYLNVSQSGSKYISFDVIRNVNIAKILQVHGIPEKRDPQSVS